MSTDGNHESHHTANPAPSGLGGWMLLPFAGMAYTLIGTGRNLWSITDNPELVRGIAGAIGDPASPYRPALYSVGGGLVLMFFAATALLAMVLKTNRAPALAQIFFICLVLDAGLEAWLGIALQPGSPDWALFAPLAGTIVGAAIWIPYFRRSKRVANTFRNR